MTTAFSTPRSLDSGRVISQCFGLIARNPVTVGAVVLAFSVLPGILFQVTSAAIVARHSGWWPQWGLTLASSLALFSLFGLCRAAMTPAAIADAEGREAELGACFGAAARRGVVAVLVDFICGLAILLGTILLVIPGLMASAALAISVPASVNERLGPFAAVRRSLALTQGNRWAVFGVLFVLGALGALANLVASLALKAVLPVHAPYLAEIADGVISGLSNALTFIGSTVLYVELTRLRDGGLSDQLATVFE